MTMDHSEAAAASLSADSVFAAGLKEGALIPPRPDLSERDYVSQLLAIGAHVEHALMVQYLYAAYSLRAERAEDRELIERWRATLLTVAREEMGHLLTVQNILTLIGAPTDFGRDSSLWASHFYPFRFGLEPFSHDVLVRFVFAEMPSEKELTGHDVASDKPLSPEVMKPYTQNAGDKRTDRLIDELIADINRQKLRQHGHRVGPTYAAIIDRLADAKKIPDSCFDERSFERQASFDEWGRNYRPEPYQVSPEGDKVDEKKAKRRAAAYASSDAQVHVRRVATRADAIEALKELSEQGEAPKRKADDKLEPSHYQRFFTIYGELRELEKKHGKEHALGSRRIIRNPTTRIDWAKSKDKGAIKYHYIEAGRAHFLAQIFNQRYRLLLNYLAHTFRIARPARFDRPNLRSMLMHRAFAEMYNLKTLAGLLTELPISEAAGETRLAGPPFEMPPSLSLPMRETDVWRGHRDLLAKSADTMRLFLAPERFGQPEYTSDKVKGTAAEAYVKTLLQIDATTIQWIDSILGSAAGRESNF